MKVRTVIVSRNGSPLDSLKKIFRVHDHWLVLEESNLSCLSNISAEELWIDGCIDLYRFDPGNVAYFYRFFSDIHYFLESVRRKFKTVRLIRYFSYDTDFEALKKNFCFYRTFTDYFEEAYDIFPLYIPDTLEFNRFPTNLFQRTVIELISRQTITIPWKKMSTFAVIGVDDIFSNLRDYDLNRGPVSITGLNICLGDFVQSMVVVWGGTIRFEEAYIINRRNVSQTQELNGVIYSLEDILINMLK